MPVGPESTIVAVIEGEQTMSKVDHFKLRFGPYSTPGFRYGQTVTCLMRGKVKVIGITDAPIQWPTCQDHNHSSPILFGSLVRAVRRESNQAVARAWGVSGQTVTKWRKALSIRKTEGTTALRKEMMAHEPWAKRAQKAMFATLSRLERGAKISAALAGRKKSPEHIEKVRQANLGYKHSAEARRKMSMAQKKLGRSPNLLGREWTPEEDELLRTLPATEVVRRTNRTPGAVKTRWRRLGLPDRRKLRPKRKE